LGSLISGGGLSLTLAAAIRNIPPLRRTNGALSLISSTESTKEKKQEKESMF